MIENGPFKFSDESFADIQMLRYRLRGFVRLTLRQKCLVYCLSKATLFGRDITFDQYGRFNLRIRRLLEWVYVYSDRKDDSEWDNFVTYLKRVWFSNGIYHHYGSEKIMPDFSETFLSEQVHALYATKGHLLDNESISSIETELFPIIFDPMVLPKKVNKASGQDLVLTSACNFYENVSQQEVEDYYQRLKGESLESPSWGLNTTLVKTDCGELKEVVWKLGGHYGAAIERIVYWLRKAVNYAETPQQADIIQSLITFYETGNLRDFDHYCIEWVSSLDGQIDFINGFIEVYNDPLGFKGTWEGIVEIKDMEATQRTQVISSHAQWFEDNSPVDRRFKKSVVVGVSANAVEAAMLGGEEYPSSAIGINLPNSDWIRAKHGSKSVTISNLTHAYDEVAKGNGFREEFVIDEATIELMNRWGGLCDDLHTDLHECLGHGSGKLLEGVSSDALKAYGNTIEEARADLFGLYYMADKKLVELGLLPDEKAYQAQYYSYLLNGLLTQLVRIKPGHVIEEAHMRNRALIARWVLAHAGGAVELVTINDKTYVRVNDYTQIRKLFAILLSEVQRIKSEGDYQAAHDLVEENAIHVDEKLHREILSRYHRLGIAPYKGFINPKMTVVKDANGAVKDIEISYNESFAEQMLRYSREYNTLI